MTRTKLCMQNFGMLVLPKVIRAIFANIATNPLVIKGRWKGSEGGLVDRKAISVPGQITEPCYTPDSDT
jgi:hypothetical protein